MGASVLLAWLTKRIVEDPPQRWQRIRRPALTAALTVAAMLLVSGAAGLELVRVTQLQDTARAQLAEAQDDPCFAAAAMAGAGRAGCADPFRPPVSFTLTADDQYWFADPACTLVRASLERSTAGSAHGRPRGAWSWSATPTPSSGAAPCTGSRSSSTGRWSSTSRVGARPPTPAWSSSKNTRLDTSGCQAWAQDVSRAVTQGHFDLVVTSSFTTGYTYDASPGQSTEYAARGFASMWDRWTTAGSDVAVTGHPHHGWPVHAGVPGQPSPGSAGVREPPAGRRGPGRRMPRCRAIGRATSTWRT